MTEPVASDEEIVGILSGGGLADWTARWGDPGAPLTRATLDAAIAKVNESTYEVCPGGGGDRHVVHPLDYERGGYVPCGGCGAIVEVRRG